jgi:hypothetical protein
MEYGLDVAEDMLEGTLEKESTPMSVTWETSKSFQKTSSTFLRPG